MNTSFINEKCRMWRMECSVKSIGAALCGIDHTGILQRQNGIPDLDRKLLTHGDTVFRIFKAIFYLSVYIHISALFSHL